MKHEMVAVPEYKERISPLLDVAKKFAVYEIEEGEIKQKITLNIHSDDEPARIDKLKDIGITVIIGGAVSGFVSEIIREKGIRLISWMNGPVDNVIESYINGSLKSAGIGASGCRRRRGRRHGLSSSDTSGSRNNNAGDLK